MERTHELTVEAIEALEAIELPAREAMSGGTTAAAALSVNGLICLQAVVVVNIDIGGGLGCLPTICS
jgi:hypothetical protein